MGQVLIPFVLIFFLHHFRPQQASNARPFLLACSRHASLVTSRIRQPSIYTPQRDKMSLYIRPPSSLCSAFLHAEHIYHICMASLALDGHCKMIEQYYLLIKRGLDRMSDRTLWKYGRDIRYWWVKPAKFSPEKLAVSTKSLLLL